MKFKKLFLKIFLSCLLSIFMLIESNGQGTGTIIIRNETVPASSGIDFKFELNYEEPIELEINSPSNIVGNYTATSSSFGPLSMNTSINGDIQLAVPILGDLAPLDDLTGKIALIERGFVPFITKVKNAQDAGAIAVIVYNNQPGAALIKMGGEDPSINIPSYFISYEDADIIKTALLSGNVNATLRTGIKERFTLQHGEAKTITNIPAGNHTVDIYEPFFSSWSTGYMARSIDLIDPSGGSSVDMTILKGNIELAADETVEVKFINHKPVYANLRTFLEGPYNTANGNMDKNLNFYVGGQDLIPYLSPYLADPRYQLAYPQNLVDWVLIELRDKNDPLTTITSRSAFLLDDGNIVDIDGVSPVAFNVDEDDYYIAVIHRNHLPVMSSNLLHLLIKE